MNVRIDDRCSNEWFASNKRWLILPYFFLKQLIIYIKDYILFRMAQEKIQMPSSGGGLVRYFDDYKSKIEIKPHYVLAVIVLIIIIEIFLHTKGVGILG